MVAAGHLGLPGATIAHLSQRIVECRADALALPFGSIIDVHGQHARMNGAFEERTCPNDTSGHLSDQGAADEVFLAIIHSS